MRRYTNEELDEMCDDELFVLGEESVRGFTDAEDAAFRVVGKAAIDNGKVYNREYFSSRTPEELSGIFGVRVTESVRYAVIVSLAYEEWWGDFDAMLENGEEDGE